MGVGVGFWEDRQPPAVLKHSVLRRYLRVFAPKTGSNATNRRVVYVDAFAGAGRYEDGSAASPVIALELAEELATWGTRAVDLDCIFIENDPATYAKLATIVPEDRAWFGDAHAHLDAVLKRAEGQPLFMFVDPFGQPSPFEDLTGAVLARPRRPGRATEVLMNFSVTALQRNAGRVEQRNQRLHADSVLDGFNAAMDGTWWQEQGRKLAQNSGASNAERREVERGLVDEYAQRITDRTGYAHIIAPIWRHGWKTNRPFFYLMFLTAHPQGVWFYVDALADAMDEYYEATHVTGHDLLDRPQVRRERATDVISENIKSLVASRGEFSILDATLEIFEGALGDGGRTEVAEAVNRLRRRGEIDVQGSIAKSKIWEARVSAGSTPGLFS